MMQTKPQVILAGQDLNVLGWDGCCHLAAHHARRAKVPVDLVLMIATYNTTHNSFGPR